MANSNEESVQKIQQTPETMPNKPLKIKNHSSIFKNKYLPILALIIALGAVSITVYTLFLNKRLQNQLHNEHNQFSVQLKQLEQKQEQTQKQFAITVNHAEKAQISLHTQLEQLSKQLQTAMSQRFYQDQDWLLLKARYYLELAQINAHWSKNIDSTIMLLQQADFLLKQFTDPKIFDMRQAIAKDIAQLQAIPRVDISGLLSQLDAAQNSINDLSIPLPAMSKQPAAGNSVISNEKPSAWHLRLQESMNFLEKLVVIQHHDQNIQPLISPLFTALIKENLHLNLQEAQWAILNNNPVVYHLVLEQAIKSLKMNFQQGNPKSSALIKKLIELQQSKLTQEKPAIGSALPMLNKLIDSQKNFASPSIHDKQGGKQ